VSWCLGVLVVDLSFFDSVNSGGSSSIIRLAGIPSLEEESPLQPCAATALLCWRARPGALLTVVAPDHSWYRARLLPERDGAWACRPFQRLVAAAESPARLVVCQALPDKERFELVLEKLTELGVSRIVPFTCSRSTTLEERDARQRKSHRWPDLLLAAARQCRRGMIPELAPVQSFDDLLAGSADPPGVLLYEGAAPLFLRQVLRERPRSLRLIIGPEGGFTPEEVEQATARGCRIVSLGGRVLRTETAAIVAATLAQYELGDLGGELPHDVEEQ
jgi:16S rRNA (uracil1498-N3)-methyltransferase